MTDFSSLSPAQFAAELQKLGRRRAAFTYDETQQALTASQPELSSLARSISGNARDFAQHEAIFLEVGQQTGALFGAFLHRTVRGQGAGGVRHWAYPTLADFITDGLRLSRGMGRKNALAGLWWGGGKGVIARQAEDGTSSPDYRQALFREYGAFISSLRGLYVTAEDVGTSPADIAEIHHTTRFVTCVPPAIGGSGNPSISTAQGVICAMEGALSFLGKGSLEGKKIAVQGAGNVGSSLVGFLLQKGAASVVVAEISGALHERLLSTYRDSRLQVRHVGADDVSIYNEPCDILAPCALGGVLGPHTIGLLQTPLVCGAANNQLLDDTRDDLTLKQRGITFVPDFVANRMGIVNCANEQYGWFQGDPAIARHFGRDWPSSVYNVTRDVLQRATKENSTPSRAANALADELMEQRHPIWGHRGKEIVQALLHEGW